MKYIFAILSFSFVLNCSNLKQKKSSKEEYLTEIFEKIEEHSIRKDSVDLVKLKLSAFEKLKSLDSIQDCYSIIKSVLFELEDNHSFLLPKEEADNWKSTSKTNKTNELISFKGKLLKDNIGYIYQKGFSSGDSISIQKYADSLQRKIKEIDNRNLKGWILDLRDNTGGNCWPMLAGLGPILGEGVCGYFIDNKGERSSWFYKGGRAGINEHAIARTTIKPYTILNESNPIAILTGRKTASSGEVIVTAFSNKKRTKSFGMPTAGLSTGNSGFPLSDGSILFLTTSIYADRKGTVFGKEIQPDVFVNFRYYHQLDLYSNEVIEKAVEWIKKH